MQTVVAAIFSLIQLVVPVSQPEKPKEAEIPPTVVKVLDAGAESGRRPLRFKAAVGDKHAVDLRMMLKTTQETDGEADPSETMPAMEMRVVSTVDRIDEGGEIHLSQAIEKMTFVPTPGVPDEMLKQLQGITASMGKVGGDIIVTDRGITRKIDFRALDGNPLAERLADELEKSAWQFAVPVPEEAVGPGAKWQVVEKDDSDGMTVETTIEYTLQELKEDSAKAAIEMRVTMPAQDIKDDEIPDDVKMKLDSGSGKGSGDCSLAWNRLLPTALKLKAKITMSMTVTLDGEDTTTKQVIEMECEIKSVETQPAPAPAKP